MPDPETDERRTARRAQTTLADAQAALKPIPAKVLATDLDPDAKRARPHLARRGLQMVLRLLAFNPKLGSPEVSD